MPYATACRRGLGWFTAFFLAVLLTAHPTPAEAAATKGATKIFDVPAGEAISALKRTAQQSGLEIMFPANLVQGVKTNAVKGDYTPAEAFGRLTAGTALTVVWDEKSGALTVKRQSAAPKGAAPSDAKTTVAESDPVLKLDTFKVSTTVGTYNESTTSAGSKTPMNMRDVAGTIQVLNASFIEDKRAQSLEDLYPYIVGMTRESPAASGFTLRGFTNNSTNTLLNNITTDGLPGGASRFGSPTTANVDRVEVLKGPVSVLYGSMNPGGIINIVTKQPQATPGHSLTTTLASFVGAQGKQSAGESAALDSTGPLDADKHWLYRFVGYYEDVPTWRHFDWGRNYYFFPSFAYRPDKDTDVTIKVEVWRQHRFSIQDQSLVAPFGLIANVPSDHSIVYQDRQNAEYDRAEVYNLVFSHHFLNDWTVKFNVRTVQHVDGRRLLENNGLVSVLPVEDSSVQQRLRDTWNRRRYAYYDLNLYRDFGPEALKHTLLFGLAGGFETHDFNRWIFKNVAGPNINVYQPVHGLTTYPAYDPVAGPTQIAISKYYNYAAYVSDQIKIGHHWHASFGVHTEKYDTKYTDLALKNGAFVNPGKVNRSTSTVPSAGLVYQPADTMSLYASYAESFKPSPPQIVDGYGAGFPPEKANQKEIGAKADFLNHRLGLLLSIYDITRSNVSEPVPQLFDANGVQVYRNLSSVSRGVELSVNYQPEPYFQMQLGYTSDDAHVSQSAQPTVIGAQLANAPRQSGNFWTRYNVPDGALRGFGVGFGLIYTGARNGVLSNVSTSMLTIPSNTRADLAFYYKWKHCDCAINVTNLTDRSYIGSADASTDVVPGAPRKITVSARYAF
jgi:iron complex outermembrane receptor protein